MRKLRSLSAAVPPLLSWDRTGMRYQQRTGGKYTDKIEIVVRAMNNSIKGTLCVFCLSWSACDHEPLLPWQQPLR